MEENALKHVKIARTLTATNVSKNVKPVKKKTVVAVKENVIKSNARNCSAKALSFHVFNAESSIAETVLLTAKSAKRRSVWIARSIAKNARSPMTRHVVILRHVPNARSSNAKPAEMDANLSVFLSLTNDSSLLWLQFSFGCQAMRILQEERLQLLLQLLQLLRYCSHGEALYEDIWNKQCTRK